MIRRALAALLLPALLSGCAAHAPYAEQGVVSVFVAPDAGSVRLVRASESALPDGTLRISFTLQPHPLAVPAVLRYRAIWFDRDGAEIRSALSAWERLTLSDDRPVDRTLVGPGARAVRARIEIEKDPR